MPYPDFSADERYLISYVKSSHGTTSINPFLLGYLPAVSVMFGFAAYYQNVPLMVIAFMVLLGFRIYEEVYGSKWTPAWRSIVEKFEAALEGTPEEGDRGAG